MAMGAIIAAITTAAIKDLKTEQQQVEQKLTTVEINIKQEEMRAKLTKSNVRRLIPADFRLRQELKQEKADLEKNEAYLQAMRRKFAGLAGEMGMFNNSKTIIENAREEIRRITAIDQKMIKLEDDLLDKDVKIVLKAASGSSNDTIQSAEFYSLKDKKMNHLAAELEIYTIWLNDNEQLRNSLQKLLGFIQHNQLEELLGAELLTLQELSIALEKQNEEIMALLDGVTTASDQISALHPNN